MRYHLHFHGFHPKTLEATQALFASRPWSGMREDPERTMQKMRIWIEAVSDVYGVDKPRVVLRSTDPVAELTCGHYNFDSNLITVPRPSVVTIMHEFRHVLQFGIPLEPRNSSLRLADQTGVPWYEHDARGWSLSLFYTVRPVLYRRLVREGKILFVEPEDLLAAHVNN